MLRTIRHGDAGDLVRAAQLLTRYAKLNEATGQYNANFVAYVVSWQSMQNVVSDGIIGPKTWTAIANSAPTCSTSKNKTSAETQALQILLDGANLTEDGIFGSRTKNAVAAFQASAGLKVDGICGPKTWHALIVEAGEKIESSGDVIPSQGEFRQPVNYKQHDSRWGSKMYSGCNNKDQTMANSGCGPTAMADIVATLVDPNVTPWTLAQLSMQWGTRNAPDGGTNNKFFPLIAEYYGFEKMVTTTSLTTLKACLDAGGYAVCHMGPSFWTAGGHFICAWKYDSKYIYCNDPSSPTSKRAERTKQELSQFTKERKGNYYCFYPQIKGKQPVTPTTDKKIIDISKHDGNIDFATLKDNVSLVIARCSLGSDIDVRFDVYAQQMNDLNIPFGVYCYSYARDDAKAKDEAQKMVFYASRYNPLFFVIDAEEECITRNTIVAFEKELRRLGVHKVGCYVAHHRYKEYKYAEIADKFDLTWIPRYGKNNGTIEGAKKPDYPCDLWQYTDEGTIAGINGKVDLNAITGEGHDLEWFLSR